MRLLVFGASGGVGAAICRAASARGDRVTAFVRSRARLPADVAAAAAAVFEGDALDAKAVAAAVHGGDTGGGGGGAAFDAVLVAIGGAGIMARDHIRSTSTRNVIAAMAAAPGAPFAAPLSPGGGARLVVCSSMGVNESGPWIPQFIAWMLKHALADHGEQEDAVRASQLPFVIARPTGLSNDPAAGSVRTALTGAVPTSRVSRADVARFMLQCLSSGEFLGKAVGLCAPA